MHTNSKNPLEDGGHWLDQQLLAPQPWGARNQAVVRARVEHRGADYDLQFLVRTDQPASIAAGIIQAVGDFRQDLETVERNFQQHMLHMRTLNLMRQFPSSPQPLSGVISPPRPTLTRRDETHRQPSVDL